MSEPRLCPTCVFFSFDPGSPDYSSWTPGWSMTLACSKGHWSLNDDSRMHDARTAMHTAETCADYQRYEEPAPPTTEGT